MYIVLGGLSTRVHSDDLFSLSFFIYFLKFSVEGKRAYACHLVYQYMCTIFLFLFLFSYRQEINATTSWE
uniref:Uncharacterized protein n=1 Tax=Cannabis sativa TaxID=3483 RepID=A0A803R2W6_CANSA